MIICPRLIGLAVGICVLAATTCAIGAPARTVEEAYPGFATDALAYAILDDLPENEILLSGEYKIGPRDLNEQIRLAPEKLWPQMKRNLFFVLESLAGTTLLQYEAELWAEKNPNSAPENPEDLFIVFMEYITRDVTATDEEVKAYYDSEKENHPEIDFEKAKDQLKEFVIGQKKSTARSEYIRQMGKRYVIKVDKTWLAKQYSAAIDNPLDKARKSGKPTFVAFTSTTCKPCELMEPIIEAVKKEHSKTANILVVSMDTDPVLGSRYAIEALPSQIFFDKSGKESFRHTGLYSKELIVERLQNKPVKK